MNVDALHGVVIGHVGSAPHRPQTNQGILLVHDPKINQLLVLKVENNSNIKWVLPKCAKFLTE